MQNVSEIEELTKLISKLPGLGPKSAKRIILKLINNKDELYKPMVNSMAKVFKNVIRCNICGSLKSSKETCINCEESKSKELKICVVETIADQWSIESSSVFNGFFHILGGNISDTSMDNKKNLLIDSLVDTVSKKKIEEVIIATSSTVEGQTTAYYIQECLKDINVKVSILGQGVPVGGEIDNLDDGTLISAFNNRKKF